MGIVTFTKVQRLGTHAIIALVGMSGSGKTYSAILIARGLVGATGKLAMLDTENGRGRMYANLGGGYDYGELSPPFTPERYIEAIKVAEDAGYDALIIDSGSHEWEGIGGTLEIADAGKTKDGDALKGLVKWANPKARHKRFVQALLNTRMHLIICLRAKEKMAQKGDKIISEGYISIQDKRFIYETTVQLFMSHEDQKKLGVPRLDKCPEDLLAAFPHNQKITVETGKKISDWVAGGIPIDHGLEALRRRAVETAECGMAMLETFWKELPTQEARMLKPYLENLKSIAASADEGKPVTFETLTAEPVTADEAE